MPEKFHFFFPSIGSISMSFSSGPQLIQTMSKMKPLRNKTKDLKQQLLSYMTSQNLKTCAVSDKTCTLYDRKVKKPMNKKMLAAQLQTYNADDRTKEQIEQFLQHCQNHLESTATVKPAIRIK